MFKIKEMERMIKGTCISYYLRVNGIYLTIMSMMFFTFLFVHLGACFWAGLYYYYEDTSKTWVFRHKFRDLGKFEIYIASVYYCLGVLTTVGYGDIIPYTHPEVIFTTVLMFFGVVFYSFLIGAVTTIVTNSGLHFKIRQKKIACLDQFC